ncbi:methyltransferase domain-containing protein [Nonomuraea phyllanthi]|uniref:class I SAM-dependent methyltransferase n=1 Tax=Nonomuraea phyllanthi TaxID=2219224 RepID=UPI001293ACB9|nr:class I SAM-dependent methyltransferase [Nonomuraea phyllanthi]QFY11421.1 methyltransferase domain-containing protein [Nonomuraea phyllanthi]
MPEAYWNHNVHYQRLVLDLVPEGCERALDVGCGDGLLASRLAARVPLVTGADRNAEAVAMARRQHGHLDNVTFVECDYLDDPAGTLSEGKYDLVTAVAVLHHADFRQATDALARLLAPGGRLVVIGLGQDRSLVDWAVRLAGQAASHAMQLRHGRKRGPGVPAMDAVMPWGEIRRAARWLLPGCRFRRLLLRRYLLVWDKPR